MLEINDVVLYCIVLYHGTSESDSGDRKTDLRRTSGCDSDRKTDL